MHHRGYHDDAESTSSAVTSAPASGSARHSSPSWRDAMMGIQRCLASSPPHVSATYTHTASPHFAPHKTHRAEVDEACQEGRAALVREWMAYTGPTNRLVHFTQAKTLSQTGHVRRGDRRESCSTVSWRWHRDGHGGETDTQEAACRVARHEPKDGELDTTEKLQQPHTGWLPVESDDVCALVCVLAEAACYILHGHVQPSMQERIVAAEMMAWVSYLVCHDLPYAVWRLPGAHVCAANTTAAEATARTDTGEPVGQDDASSWPDGGAVTRTDADMNLPRVKVSESEVAHGKRLLRTVAAVLCAGCRSRRAHSSLYTVLMSCLGLCEHLCSAEVAELTLCMAQCAERYALEQELQRLRGDALTSTMSDGREATVSVLSSAEQSCDAVKLSHVGHAATSCPTNENDDENTKGDACPPWHELLYTMARYYAHPLPGVDDPFRTRLDSLCFPSLHACEERAEEERQRGGHGLTITPVSVTAHMHVLAHTLHRRIAAQLDCYHVHGGGVCAGGAVTEPLSHHIPWQDCDAEAEARARRRYRAHCASLTLSPTLSLQARQSAASAAVAARVRACSEAGKATHDDDRVKHIGAEQQPVRRALIGEGVKARRCRRTVGALTAAAQEAVNGRLAASVVAEPSADSTAHTSVCEAKAAAEAHVVQLADVARMCTALGSVRYAEESWWVVATRFVCWYVHCYADDVRVLHRFGVMTPCATHAGHDEGEHEEDVARGCVRRCVRDVCFALDHVRQDALYDTIMTSLTRHGLLDAPVERPSSRRRAVERAQAEQMMPRREASTTREKRHSAYVHMTPACAGLFHPLFCLHAIVHSSRFHGCRQVLYRFCSTMCV